MPLCLTRHVTWNNDLSAHAANPFRRSYGKARGSDDACQVPGANVQLVVGHHDCTFELFDLNGHALPSYSLRFRHEMDLFKHFDFFNANELCQIPYQRSPRRLGALEL